VVRIQRVRLADGMPLSFDETYLPKELGEKVMADNLETEPIFSLLEQKYRTPLVEAEYQLEAICADATVATSDQVVGLRTRVSRCSFSLSQDTKFQWLSRRTVGMAPTQFRNAL